MLGRPPCGVRGGFCNVFVSSVFGRLGEDLEKVVGELCKVLGDPWPIPGERLEEFGRCGPISGDILGRPPGAVLPNPGCILGRLLGMPLG